MIALTPNIFKFITLNDTRQRKKLEKNQFLNELKSKIAESVKTSIDKKLYWKDLSLYIPNLVEQIVLNGIFSKQIYRSCRYSRDRLLWKSDYYQEIAEKLYDAKDYTVKTDVKTDRVLALAKEVFDTLADMAYINQTIGMIKTKRQSEFELTLKTLKAIGDLIHLKFKPPIEKKLHYKCI